MRGPAPPAHVGAAVTGRHYAVVVRRPYGRGHQTLAVGIGRTPAEAQEDAWAAGAAVPHPADGPLPDGALVVAVPDAYADAVDLCGPQRWPPP